MMLPLLSALIVTAVIAPVTQRLAVALRIVDRFPRYGRYPAPIPLLGGLAMLVGWITGLLVHSHWNPLWELVVAGAVLIFLLGAWDDVKPLGATKLVIELAAISVLLGLGLRPSVPGYLLPVTILWVAGVMNAVNCLDCADGSAAAVALIGSLGLALLGVIWGQWHTPLLVALTGAVAGFLLYNLPPARQFMGDAGSKFLGFVLAMAGLLVLPPDPQPSHLIAMALMLGVPVMDFALVHLRRYRSQTRNLIELMTSRGTDHLPHRLMNAGLSPRRTIAVLVGLALLTAALSAVATAGVYPAALAVAALMAAMLGLEALLRRRAVPGPVCVARAELPTSIGG